ncbi:MAG: MtnX-like HAD-IB family phosphatase [Deinococcus sp.]|nr:MtnX-like HAD-IB family phosphatase [Deinococcus sp.]
MLLLVLEVPLSVPASPMVFCDFDGTITEEDMIIAICRGFAPPEWEAIKDDILAQRRDVRSGVAAMFGLIPSPRREDIVQFARKTARIRAGFGELLDYCQQVGIPFQVVSGGVDFFVYPVLEPYLAKIDRVYTIEGDFSSPTIQLRYPYGSATSGTSKPLILEQYREYYRILIGDSITDLEGARIAELVFARDRLCRYLEAEGMAYQCFETFHDVHQELERRQARGVWGS